MSRCSDLALAVVLAASVAGAALAAPQPADRTLAYGFGKTATPAEIAGWDIDVRPDGTGLPPGRGSVEEGQQIYDAKCASCHGTFGESTDYLPLAGGVGSLGTSQPVRTTGSKLNYATTLFDYIRRAMPFPDPKTLSDDEVYALTAYVLNLNDVLPADAALDRDSLPKVKMPNRDGFTTDHGFMRRDGKPDTHNVACMRNCVATVRLSSEMPDYARDSHGNLAEQTRDLGPVEGARASAPMVAQAGGAELARKAGCMACHAVTTKVVGPAFRDVAARYSGNAGAHARLLQKIRTGGSGTWGDVPMPPQSVPDPDANAVLKWVLSGAR
jgi:cytochrome c